MEITKIYLSDFSAVTDRLNEVLYYFHYFCHNDEVIIICHAHLIYFMGLFCLMQLCFRKLRKCLSKKFLEKKQRILFPDKFEQLIF